VWVATPQDRALSAGWSPSRTGRRVVTVPGACHAAGRPGGAGLGQAAVAPYRAEQPPEALGSGPQETGWSAWPVTDNHGALGRLIDQLLEHETIDGEDVLAALAAEPARAAVPGTHREATSHRPPGQESLGGAMPSVPGSPTRPSGRLAQADTSSAGPDQGEAKR